MSSAKRLTRMSPSGKIAGVCAGIADYLDVDVTLVRLVWIVLSIVPGGIIGGIVAYIAAWAIMPDSTFSTNDGAARRQLVRSTVDRKIAGVCGGLAEYLAIDPTAVRLLWMVLSIVPGAIVLGVVAYVVAWFIMPEAPAVPVVVSPSVA